MKKSTIKKRITGAEEKDAGHFNLFPLFACVTEYPKQLKDGDEKSNNSYKKAVVKLLEDAHISHTGGWFIEGNFSDKGFWQSRSVDKASDLYAHLKDELQKEYIAIYAEVYKQEKLGAYFVMWEAAPDWMTDKDICLVETVLIDKFRPGYDGKCPWVEKKLLYNEAMSVRPFVETMENEIGKILGQKYSKGR